MTEHSNSPIDVPTPPQGRHGSTFQRYPEGIDARQVAATSEEGGTTGAALEALDRASSSVRDLARRVSEANPRVWVWLLAAGGVSAVCAFWLHNRAKQSKSFWR
jgi:hypothetical protein